eukprot:2608341-Amphidinium_carterae.1
MKARGAPLGDRSGGTLLVDGLWVALLCATAPASALSLLKELAAMGSVDAMCTPCSHRIAHIRAKKCHKV